MQAPHHAIHLAAQRAESLARFHCASGPLLSHLQHLERVAADLSRLTWTSDDERAFALATAWLWGITRLLSLASGLRDDFPARVSEAVETLLLCEAGSDERAMERVRSDRTLCMIRLADLRARISDQAAAFERLARLFEKVRMV